MLSRLQVLTSQPKLALGALLTLLLAATAVDMDRLTSEWGIPSPV